MFVRSLAIFVVGLGLLSLAWLRPAQGGWLRKWGSPLAGFVGWLLVVIDAMNLSAMALSALLFRLSPHASRWEYLVVASIGVLGGAYACAMGLQVLGNAVRRAQGLRPRKIAWIRRWRRQG